MEKGAQMSQERVVYRVQTGAAPLAGVFEEVFQRVASSPTTRAARVLAGFAASLANGDEFNLGLIEQLPDAADRDLCLALFQYCLSCGLTEDARSAVAAAFAPYADMRSPGECH